jgi:vancomycin resistance protein VanW
MKSILKPLLPAWMRMNLRLLWILIQDLFSGVRFRFVRNFPEKLEAGRGYQEQVTITQRINISKWADNKKHNLSLAISKFQNLPIYPGEVFSFWHLVGNPTKKAGYKVGHNIIQSQLAFDYGGGLCQLSGLLYHLAITVGIGIVERHPHSVDLYTDETRYTPLGADATTAYGYKDLRLKNTMDIPFCFRIQLEDNSLIGSLCAPDAIKEHEVIFNKKIIDGKEEVETLRRLDSGDCELLNKQTYLISDHQEVI